jgi:hypothetical protein
MQFTVGGDRINYPGKVAAPTAEMLVAKMLFNSVISTKGAQFMTMDISNFYLMTPLHCANFIQIKISDIPDEVIREYKLREKATKNRSIYIRAKRGMYGLPQAGLLANKLLKNASTNTDTGKANWYRDFGSMTQDPYSSHWLLMISASNTLAMNMHNISRTHSKNTTTYMRLDRQTIHWDNIGLGLQQAPCPSIHAKLRAKSFEIISTQSRQTTACAIPKCTNPTWHKETIRNTRIGGATIRQQSQTFHPTGMQQVLIPW